MELRIKSIYNPGDLEREYIEIFVNFPASLKDFMISDYSHIHACNNKPKRIFWFPDLNVKTGSVIRLNTRRGRNDYTGLIDIFWNLDEALWKNRFTTAYLIKIDNFCLFPETKNYMDTLFSSD